MYTAITTIVPSNCDQSDLDYIQKTAGILLEAKKVTGEVKQGANDDLFKIKRVVRKRLDEDQWQKELKEVLQANDDLRIKHKEIRSSRQYKKLLTLFSRVAVKNKSRIRRPAAKSLEKKKQHTGKEADEPIIIHNRDAGVESEDDNVGEEEDEEVDDDEESDRSLEEVMSKEEVSLVNPPSSSEEPMEYYNDDRSEEDSDYMEESVEKGASSDDDKDLSPSF
jgi:hypothetical protein